MAFNRTSLLTLGIWKSDLVHQHFLPHEVWLILGIPLSSRFPADRVAWSLTPSGKFSTSSAYKFLAATASASQAGSSNSDQLHLFWRRIWRLRVPNKIIHFIWRACNNALPTKCNLRRRQIISSDTCELCHGAAEDVIHAL
nr:putative ribonuclease h protein [Quercus suber]